MPACCGAELEWSESKYQISGAVRGVKKIKWCVSGAEGPLSGNGAAIGSPMDGTE